ncbi:MAG: hydrogenase/urease maturation nickel metallochaperone HypA [Candidatus Brocadiaceae bacterium]|nr:hydrogenase/urease maturation nickel metallochaperone HypA [Candidatus Brocadiaceae bacterium]
MHEASLIKDLIRKISSIALEQHASKVLSVTIKLGALSYISPDHFHEHFIHASHGTISEGAQINIEILSDTNEQLSQEVVIDNIEISTS